MIATIAATNPRVALVDLAAVTTQIASSPTGTISFGGEHDRPVDARRRITTTSSSPTAIHVGTVGQGIIADEFAHSIDTKFGAQLFPPTPAGDRPLRRHDLQPRHALPHADPRVR